MTRQFELKRKQRLIELIKFKESKLGLTKTTNFNKYTTKQLTGIHGRLCERVQNELSKKS